MSVRRQRRGGVAFAGGFGDAFDSCGAAAGMVSSAIFQSEGAYWIPRNCRGYRVRGRLARSRVAAQGDHFGYSGGGVPLRRNDFDANLNPMPKFARSDQAASVGVHEGGIALFGKGMGGVEAGHADRNFQRQASIAPDRVLCFFRRAHRFSDNREKIGANRSSDKCALIMLDHKKAVSTEFRRAGFQLDTSEACVARGCGKSRQPSERGNLSG